VRVPRCFAFVDVSGFTALTDREGDEVAVAMLSDFRSLVREVCSRRGVRVAKWLGDGAMLVGVEATPVLAALLEMEFAVAQGRLELAIRSGVSVGEVILHEGDDYIGHAVNVAARLCDLAPGGEVLATPEAAEALPRWGMVLSTESVEIRGLQEPLEVARVGLRPPGAWARPDPVCGIPLTRSVSANQAQDAAGRELWFCSDSCRDTWDRRPAPLIDEPGSLRTPLIGT